MPKLLFLFAIALSSNLLFSLSVVFAEEPSSPLSEESLPSLLAPFATPTPNTNSELLDEPEDSLFPVSEEDILNDENEESSLEKLLLEEPLPTENPIPLLPAPLISSVPLTPQYTPFVKLQGLNKLTAKRSLIEGEVKAPLHFGSLEILVSLCWHASPEDPPESKALVKVWETSQTEPKSLLFNGWMFSSSPGLSGLEHPIYDIILLNCDPLAAN